MSAQDPIRVGVAGVRDYVGHEVAKLLCRHPRFQVITAASDSAAGKRLSDLAPDLAGGGDDAVVVGYNDAVSTARSGGVQLMMLAMTAETSSRMAPELLAAGIRVIDLAGAFRLRDPVAHAFAYGFERPAEALEVEAVYGLTEWLETAALREGKLVANPGSYPTAVLLALLPLARRGLIEPGSLVVDAKVGTTAAGRSARVTMLHSEIFANFYAYRVGRHEVAPEIAQELAEMAGGPVDLTFVAHLLPVARGVLATSYLRVPGDAEPAEAAHRVYEALREAYDDEPFVHVLDRAEDVHLRAVTGTNRCLVSATADPFGRRVVVVSTIDNLLKGSAGQAVQNANLMFGLPQTMGLAPFHGR